MNKWSHDNIIHFLEIYQHFDVLWDTSSKSYRDKKVRDSAFKKLIYKLNEGRHFNGINIDIVRNKIKMIKTMISQELGKIAKSKKSGGGYQPKLKWFSSAEFLMKSSSTRDSKTNLHHNDKQCGENKQNEIEVCENMQEHNSKVLQSTAKIPKNKSPRKLKRPTQIPKKKCKINELDKVNATIVQLRQLAESSQACNQNKEEEDELVCFGKYVTAQLKKLPTYSSNRCQQLIQDIIFKEKMMQHSAPPLQNDTFSNRNLYNTPLEVSVNAHDFTPSKSSPLSYCSSNTSNSYPIIICDNSPPNLIALANENSSSDNNN